MSRTKNDTASAARWGTLLMALAATLGGAMGVHGCMGTSQASSDGANSAAGKTSSIEPVELVIDNGLVAPWQDWGWAPRDIVKDEAARVNFADYGGWILARRGAGQVLAQEIQIEVHASDKARAALELRLIEENGNKLPEVHLRSVFTRLSDGWYRARISLAALNPQHRPFNRINLRAIRQVDSGWVKIRKIGFYGEPDEHDIEASSSFASGSGGPAFGSVPVSMKVSCRDETTAINPMIYGIAFSPRRYGKSTWRWTMKPTGQRWGGNPASRYNWKLGNAWNTAADWFFRNVDYTDEPDFSWRNFLDDGATRGTFNALTIPMLGHVAKDTKSYSFSVARDGKQQRVDPYFEDIGNGLNPAGEPIPVGPTSRTSNRSTSETTASWVREIVRHGKQEKSGGVDLYLLGNEPMLWHDTHRDVARAPLTYDGLLQKTIAYSAAIRRHDPKARIGGPSAWGWAAYFYSALDLAKGATPRLDRKAHGDVPLIPWYLRELRRYEKSTGRRTIDLLNVHFYPQSNVYAANTGTAMAARRIRSTRGLWDPNYTDESWIKDEIELLPRLRRWVDENHPGLGISIGEYNFGGEKHMSGGLALAEALGRFGQHGVSAAFYWTFPPEGSPAARAFETYRNYDGQGAAFQRHAMPTKVPRNLDGGFDTSLFASRNEGGGLVVLVALNFDPEHGAIATIALDGCRSVVKQRTFRYAADGREIEQVESAELVEGGLMDTLPPYSITVFELMTEVGSN